MAQITVKDVYCGTPTTARGEPAKLGTDPTNATDDICYGSGSMAIVRSSTSPLKCTVFGLHSYPVTVVRLSPDGNLVASADEGGLIRLWERATLKQKAELHVYGGPIRDFAFSSDGKTIALAGDARGTYGKAIKVPSGGSIGVCTGHTKRCLAVDVAQTKPPVIATASEDMSIGMYKGPPIREIDTPEFLRHHTAFVNDVRFSPDGKKLATASTDKSISIVDVESGNFKSLKGHATSIYTIAWSQDGKRLLSAGADKTSRVWDVEKEGAEALVHTFTCGKDVGDMQVGCAMLPKSGEAVTVSLDGDLTFREPTADKASHVFRGHAKQIIGLALAGTTAYTADYSGRLVKWDIGTGSAEQKFSGKGPNPGVCALAANDTVVASIGQDGNVFITPRGTLAYPKPVKVKGGGCDIAVPSTTSAQVAAIVINESRVALVSPGGAELLCTLDLERGEKGSCVAVSADGTLFAAGVELPSDTGGEVRVLRLAGGKLEAAHAPIKMRSAPNRMVFSPDGSIVAVGEKGGRVRLYNVKSGELLKSGRALHSGRVDAISFADDGKFVASGGMDCKICVLNVEDEDDETREFKNSHRGGVTGIAFMGKEGLLTSGSDSCLRTWKM